MTSGRMASGRMRATVTAALAALLMVGVVVGQQAGAAAGPRVSLGSASGLERDTATGSVFVPVFLSQAAAVPVVVSFHSVDGTALAGSDYTRWGTPASPRSVTIPAGSLQSTINVPVLTDGAIEADETFSIVIQGVSGADSSIGASTGSGTIVDSDALAGPNPVVTVSSGSVVEGDSGTRRAQFSVHLSRAPATNVAISYVTRDGAALAGDDYTAKMPGTVVFAPGQISKTIDVTVASDTTTGVARDFLLEVAVLGGSPVEEVQMVGTATVVDDDADLGTSTTTSTTTTTTTTTTTPPAAPIISTWALAGTPGPVPALVPLRWSISDPAAGTLTCRIDSTDDGTYDLVVPNCPATGSRNVSIGAVGTSTARLRVESTSGRATETTRWITTTADPVEGFDLQLRGIGSLGTQEAAAFTAAAQRMEDIVIRGVADATSVPARPSCLPAASPDLPTTVDDLLIDVSVQPIDGAGGILGQAGPTCLRAGTFLPVAGQMIFDSADVANLLPDGTFATVVLHEMGHVLGFGTNWQFTNSATGLGGADPRYIGGRGVAEWSTMGGSGSVPLENTGAAGTRDSHWRESVFGAELMTGYLNNGVNPLSRLSVASFADLGYQVDVAQADGYTPPGAVAGLRIAGGAPRELLMQRATAGAL